MIRSLLIANRGEIACRIIATAKRMGVRTVAVHSTADARARHVRLADEAHEIGGPEPKESYLRQARIIAVAKEAGGDAIHPGYGFLSENAKFADLVAEAGLIFVGPPADAISAMGLKDRAKAIMDEAGVPVVPGYHGENQNPDLLRRKAYEIGYPVLIKAVAGGGGKGMRKVDKPADFTEALSAAMRETQAAFGNDDVLVEKFIENPRHIEVQVFGDGHGNVVHLFERDCSLQRRHQKVIEEAPAPGMTDEMRAAIQQRRSAKTLGSTDTLATLEQELAHRAKTVVDPTGIDDTTILRASDAIAAPQSEECEIIDTPGSGSSLGEFLVNHNGKLIERFPVTRRKVLVGRAQHNDIVLDSKWVSRYPAIIVCHRTGASLVDINSTNGMTVNSTLVRQGDLMHNDIIVIGDYRIKYLNPAAERREASDELSDTRVLKKLDTADFDVTTPVGTSQKDHNA